MSEFASLGLAPDLLRILDKAGFETPTPIQAKSIPFAVEGHDIIGLAQTGTGKTLAFGLPLINHLMGSEGRPAPKTVKALVLAPTRELVNQISDNLQVLSDSTPLRIATVVGGQSINRQIQRLSKGIDILIATPGRLIDLIDRRAVDLSTVGFLVLDEADQMLDIGFIHALRQIEPKLGKPRQTMLFSATMPKQVTQLASSYLTEPKRVEVSRPGRTADKVEQSVEFIYAPDKSKRLREILRADPEALMIVFMRTKHGAEKLKKSLVADGFLVDSVHGNKSQGQRDRAIKGFRDGAVKVLVATDVAARGIDIPGVSYVINYDLPNVPEAYVHRIGRTARAGNDGIAISFCAPDNLGELRDIEKLIKQKFERPPGLEWADDAPAPRKSGPKGRPGRGGGGHGGPGKGGSMKSGAGKPAGRPAGGSRRPRRGNASGSGSNRAAG